MKLFDRHRYLSARDLSTHSQEPPYYQRHNKQLKKKGLKISPYVYNKETLGFRLDSEREIAMFRDQAEPVVEEIDDFFDYTKNLLKTILDAQTNQHLHSDDWQRSIYIDTLGVKATDFKIKDTKKEALVKSGRKGAQNYFRWYDNPKSSPANRI